MAIMARLCHEMYTHPRIGDLLSQCEEQSLSDEQRANVREIRRGYDRATKVPKELVQELAQVTSEAQSVWQKAKETNDFPSFQPWLEKIVVLKRREADCVGYKDSPYDALVDEFEVGAKTADLKVLFVILAKELTPLVAEIVAKSGKNKADISKREFPVAIQEQISRERAKAFGFEFDRGRLDVTSHPFCTGINPGDCRILTRYDVHHPMESFFGTLHETGHGLYEQGLPANHWGTPLGSAASFGIHESQSRLWENMIGRSRSLWRGYYQAFQKAFAPTLDDIALDEFWCIVNDVRPSLIRIDADEATYNLHIILRFELELALLDGELRPADLPGAWNDKIRQYMNLSVPNDAHGCLQDIHWSFGGIGYFPTYTLGNLYAAQFLQAIERDLPSLWQDVETGSFMPLRNWLQKNIHDLGQRYRPNELCERVTGRPLSPQPFLDYLRAKFLGS